MQTRALLLAALVVAAVASPLAGRQARVEIAASRISIADFKKAFDAGKVVILDVRDAYSYAEGHIPGAVLVPPDGLAKIAAELKASTKPIVIYCGWADEHSSAGAALDLAKLGVKNAKALLGGIQAWQEAGHPIVKGTAPRR